MSWKRIRMVALAVLGLVLALTPVLVGCGGGEETTGAEITIGILADFSGAAAYAVVPTVEAFKESINYQMEQKPIEGVSVKYVQYDHQLNYAKSVDGYKSLKAQGMDLFYAMGRTEPDQLSTFLTDDHMPTISTTGRTDKLTFPWLWHSVPALSWQTEEIMKWIAEDWDKYPTKPKVGHQGTILATTDEFQAGIDNVLKDSAYADKFEFVGEDKAQVMNVTWSTQYDKWKGCDYIICSGVANGLGTFVGQMRALGYKGKFVSGTDQFSGYWAMVQNNTPAADCYGCYYAWWGPITGSDVECGWFEDLVSVTEENHPSDAAARLAGTGPISGWVSGLLAYTAIANAAEEVGADRTKIDGDALQAGMNAVNLELCETEGGLRFSEGCNTGLQSCRILAWDVNTSKWGATSDTYYEPLAGCKQ